MSDSAPSDGCYRLLFVCTANICRSPMAEEMARVYGVERGWKIEVQSGGIMGLIGKPAHKRSRKAMAEIDQDIYKHRSKGITNAMVDWANYILVMELGHQTRLHERHPQSVGKVLMLGTFGGVHEVPDPIGGWMGRFRKCRELLFKSIEGFMDHLPPPQNPPA